MFVILLTISKECSILFVNRFIKEAKENVMSQKNTKKKWWIWGISLVLLFSIVLGCGIYLGDYYHADRDAIQAVSPASIEQELPGGHLAFVPDICVAGFIFYPGGKVEHTAYIPLMRALAQKGILCVLVCIIFFVILPRPP